MKKKKLSGENGAVNRFVESVFALSKEIRYAALYRNGLLGSIARPELERASSWESDKYEEIIVNPTLLTLLRQRGDIDCGGLRHVVVRYGNFIQYIRPVRGGHLSVAFESGSGIERIVPKIEKLLRAQDLAEEVRQ